MRFAVLFSFLPLMNLFVERNIFFCSCELLQTQHPIKWETCLFLFFVAMSSRIDKVRIQRKKKRKVKKESHLKQWLYMLTTLFSWGLGSEEKYCLVIIFIDIFTHSDQLTETEVNEEKCCFVVFMNCGWKMAWQKDEER